MVWLLRPNHILLNERRVYKLVFLKIGQPRPHFVYFRSFQTQILQKKTLGFSGIRTRIDKVD